jgi:hypothetical protein
MYCVVWRKDGVKQWAIFNLYAAAELFWQTLETGWMHPCNYADVVNLVRGDMRADKFGNYILYSLEVLR